MGGSPACIFMMTPLMEDTIDMAQKSNSKRMERMEKSDRNMNRAVVLLISGLVAEWYLLMVDRYYARGTIAQFAKWYDFLGVMRWVGLAVLCGGVVLLAMRDKKPWYGKAGAALAAAGGFFAFTSFVMRHAYPSSVTAMCVLVPVILILGIVYLFYQPEFLVQASAMAMALFALALLSRSVSTTVRVLSVIALIGIAALLLCTWKLKKDGGVFKRGETSVRVFAPDLDYRLTLGVLALCLALVLIAMIAPMTAFYAMWALAVAAFVLAVYYTIKLM